MASDDFVPGAICLIKSLKKLTTYPIFVIDLGLNNKNKELIKETGGIPYTIEKIGSKMAESKPWHANSDFANNCFNKLHLWNTDYEKVIYLDADMLVLKNIDHLFEIKHDFCAGASFVLEYDAVTKKLLKAEWSEKKFNGGFLVIKPDKQIYIDLMNKKDTIKCPEDPSDQGFLNIYYENRWHRLHPRYNATRRVFMIDKKRWDELDVHVIHFTLEEPWNKFVKGCEEIEKLWWECYVG